MAHKLNHVRPIAFRSHFVQQATFHPQLLASLLQPKENLAKIQSEDTPRIKVWAQRSERCLSEKTDLIHSTSKRKEEPAPPPQER